ncbi:NAD-dependent epimerase/dehydratase family protein [Streptomyces griseoaurantiacus]|uniref:NAD-dependent epimerase/dehydratase family protein n=1 Tax=Streptomyces griseoaurantiacus TaxID=68213 RepID=UPI003460A6E8
MNAVLITGGTGKTGGALTALLRERGEPVRVASRTPAAGDPEAVRFDWADPVTHAAALHGADRVYLVPPVNALDPLPLVEPFLAEADRTGVRRVVLLASALVFPGSEGALELAERIRARPGGVVLRASGFMQNFLAPHPMGERILRHGDIRTASGDGRVGWIDARDIAAAAAAVLTAPEEDAHGHGEERSDHLLTGPAALSYRDAAATLTRHTGRTVRVVPVEPEDVADVYRAAGLPDTFAVSLAAVDATIRIGRDDRVSTAVLDLTGRPPRTFAEFVRDHTAHYR